MQQAKTATETPGLTLSLTQTKAWLRKNGLDFKLFHPMKTPGSAAHLRKSLPLPEGWIFSRDRGEVLATYDCRHALTRPKYRVVARGAKERLLVQSGDTVETDPTDWNAMIPALLAQPPQTLADRVDHKLDLVALKDQNFMADDCGYLLYSGREISLYTGAYPLFPHKSRHPVVDLDTLYFAGDLHKHNNIAHFLLDTLCRAWMAREIFGLPDSAIAFPEYAIPYCNRLRERLFPASPVLKKHQVYRVKRMLVTSYNLQLGLLHPANMQDPGFLTWLRAHVPQPETPSTSPLVFISRRDSGKRPLVNEAEIAALAAKAGFVPAVLSDLSVEAQIALFQGARIVIGAHGAGMANTAFCRPGTTMVELYNADGAGTDAFQRLSTALGLRALPFFGAGLRADEPGAKQRGWRLDPAAFQGLLDALLRL